jgi:hypothetical protein
VLCLLTVLGAVPNANAQAQRPQEYQIKSAYLYNFGKFVEWPASTSASSAFTICVLGDDPFGTTLDETLAGETVGGKSVEPKRITKVQDAGDCKVLYISSSEQRHVDQILLSLSGKNILTVSDMDNFTDHGGMIQFLWDRNKVRFEVNLNAAMKAGLMLSSELLKVATRVRQTA